MAGSVGGRFLTRPLPLLADGLSGEDAALEDARIDALVRSIAEMAPPAPTSRGLPRFVRRAIAKEMPAICARLVGRVIAEGDLPSLKMLLHMAEAEGGGAESGAATRPRFKAWQFTRKTLEGSTGPTKS